MKSSAILLLVGVLEVSLAGCGPLQRPIPVRLEPEVQAVIDKSWDEALRPTDRFDHQGLLDLLTLSRGYEAGVDKLTFRSEKRVAVGTVIMEIHFDRLAPAEDRFEVSILDAAGKPIRKEQYGREEVENTFKELDVQYRHLQQLNELTPEQKRELAGYERRFKAIEEVLPKDVRAKLANDNPGQKPE